VRSEARRAIWFVCVAALVAMATQMVMGARGKSAVSDAFFHYGFGEWVLGEPYAPRDPKLGWDGVGAGSAAHVASARLRGVLDPWLGPADDAATSPITTIPSLAWARVPSIAAALALVLAIGLVVARNLATPISAIQGTTTDSPLAGDSLVIEAVVTGVFNGDGGLGGFFVEEEAEATAGSEE